MNLKQTLSKFWFTSGAPNRMLALDLLRVTAVLLVLGRHIPGREALTNPIFRSLSEIWYTGGGVGVDLFFVLSGFLVSGLLFREFLQHGGMSAKTFYLRRGFKIYPSLYVLIGLSFLLGVHLGTRTMSPLYGLCEALYLRNYGCGIWNHTWSLAVEEHFYLMLPIALLLILHFRSQAKNPFSILPILILVLGVALLAGRLITLWSNSANSLSLVLYATHLRLDSLAFGVLLGYLYNFHNDAFMRFATRYRLPLIIGGLLLLAPVFIWDIEKNFYIATIGSTLFYLGSGMLLVGMLAVTFPLNAATRGMSYVGKQSRTQFTCGTSPCWSGSFRF